MIHKLNFLNANKLFLQFIFILFTSPFIAWGQTDLSKWNNADLTPTVISNITANPILTGGGVAIQNNNWEGFIVTGFFNGITNTIDYSKYLEFSIAPDSGYKILLSQFKLQYFSNNDNDGPTKLQIRYSTDPTFPSDGTILDSEQTLIRGSNQNLSLNFPLDYEINQALYLRVYLYGQTNLSYGRFIIRNPQSDLNNPNLYQGPTITGTVSQLITGDPADLKLTQILNNYEPNIGDNVVFTINIENLGPNTATGTRVNDQLPAGFSYVSSVASIGSYNPGTGIWTVGSFADGDTASLQITAQRQAVGPYTNNATISHDGFDSVSSNDSESVTPTNVCSGCTNTVSGGLITVGPGEIYCLESGSWSGGVELNGGTICIAEGAFFNADYTQGTFSGTVINRGTVTAFPLSNNATHTVEIINRGTFTSAYLQNFAGAIQNYGSITVSGGLETLNGSTIDNYSNMNANNISFYGTTVRNYNDAVFTVTSGVNVYSGYWDNRWGGEIYFNGGNVNYTGDLDNSGYWEFERISSLSSTLNNYGQMKVYNAASDISSTTYLTNDDLLEFIDVSEIQYNGPMLTNNGTITVTHPTTGNFKMNQAINQVFNNGIIDVSGQFEQNAAGSLLVNTCTIECTTFFVGNGLAENSGLIWASQNVSIQGTSSSVKNAATGHIRGTNFTNSGSITGFGGFYFTGTTNMNTGGSFIGDAPNSILFYDTSQTDSNIFDTPGGTVINVMRPDSMEPYDTSSYDCIAPPSVAGYPPTTEEIEILYCNPTDISTFDLHDVVTPHEDVPPNPNSFVVDYSTIKLFDFNNASNPTNNSTNLVISNKGTFSVNISTGIVTFTPHPAFTSGLAEAEYRISNARDGDPIVYPSARTKITLTIASLPDLEIDEGTSPICIGETMTFSNEVEGGVWSSSDEAVATVVGGVVTGISTGDATISYTVYFAEGDCSLTVEEDISVHNCACYKMPNLAAVNNPSVVGISTLENQLPDWPENIPNGFIVLESKNKGFVITRVTNTAAIDDPKEGMLIYDQSANCIKLYADFNDDNVPDWHCIENYCKP